MAKYYPVYKCPICGTLIQADQSREIQYNELPELLGKIIKSQQFATNPYLSSGIPPMNIPHKCPDGSGGLAQFAGFKRA